MSKRKQPEDVEENETSNSPPTEKRVKFDDNKIDESEVKFVVDAILDHLVEEHRKTELLDDEEVDGEGYEFVIHEDLDNIVSLTMQQTAENEEDEDAKGAQFRFSHSSGSASNFSKTTQLAYGSMKHFGITPHNFHTFCEHIGKKHTPFEIDLVDEEINLDRPWRRPGASLDDFFNYGFNEGSWKEYAARQVALRLKHIRNISDEEILGEQQEEE